MIGNDKDAGHTARVTIAFRGAPDGQAHPRDFRPGDVIRGTLALAEVEAGRAEWMNPPKLETKAPDSPFPTGPGELSSSPRPGRAKEPKTSRKRGEKRSS